MTTKHSVSESNHSPLPTRRGAGGEAVWGEAVTPADIAPYIPQALKELQRAVTTAKHEAERNHRQVPRIYETIKTLDITPMEYADEYILIRKKKSNLSANVREAVLTVGNLALQLLMQDTIAHVERKDELHRGVKQTIIALLAFLAGLSLIWYLLSGFAK